MCCLLQNRQINSTVRYSHHLKSIKNISALSTHIYIYIYVYVYIYAARSRSEDNQVHSLEMGSIFILRQDIVAICW